MVQTFPVGSQSLSPIDVQTRKMQHLLGGQIPFQAAIEVNLPLPDRKASPGAMGNWELELRVAGAKGTRCCYSLTLSRKKQSP